MKKKLTVKQKIEICEIIAFLGIVGLFIAGFTAWIFGAAAEPLTRPMACICLAAFLLAAWKGGVFKS